MRKTRRTDSMWKNSDYEWESVYRIDVFKNNEKYKNERLKCNKMNLKFYYNVAEKDYATLYKCADFWMKHKSHAAFVRFFIEKGRFPNEMFCDHLGKYIEEFKTKYDIKKIPWTRLQIMRSQYWRSPGVSSDKISDKQYCYKSDYISRLCNPKELDDIKIDTMEYKKKLSKGSSKESFSVPEREAIIQIGIYFNLSSKEVNELFVVAGLPCFYRVDVSDIISMYYLDMYKQEGTVRGKGWREQGEGRIREVKEEINKCLNEMLQGDASKMRTITHKSKKTGSYPEIIYEHSLCDTINDEIRKVMEVGGSEKELHLDGNTCYITRQMKSLYQERIEYGIDGLRDILLQKDKDSKYVLAMNYRYGYTRKIRNALQAGLTKGSFQKSYENIDWDFDTEIPWSYEFLDRIDKSVSDQAEASKEELSRLNVPRGFIQQRLVKIWNCANFIEGGPGVDIDTSDPSYCLRNYIYGRKKKGQRTETEAKINMNEPQTMSKTMLTKFLIATGCEDKRRAYFDSVGYGIERQWYEGDHNDEKEKTEHNSYPLDRGDMLFEYVNILKDKLIERYVKNNKDQDPNIYRKNLNKSFPFAKTMNYVTRDIQYVLYIIEENRGSEKEYSIDKYQIQKEKEMLFQRDRLTEQKNCGYCLCFPYDEEVFGRKERR